jgi:hypothetical protein
MSRFDALMNGAAILVPTSRFEAYLAKADGQARVPKGSPKGGQFAPKNGADLASAMTRAGVPAGQHHAQIEMKPAQARVFQGAVVHIPDTHRMGGPGRQTQVGDHAENLGVNYLASKGHHAVILKGKGQGNNFPFDVASYHPAHGLTLYEVKGGQPSNTKSAQQWRVTNDAKLSQADEEAIKASAAKDGIPHAEAKRQFMAGKVSAAIDRKHQAAKDIEQRLKDAGILGQHETVQVKTLTSIFNDHTKTADFFEFHGVHPLIRWNSEATQQAYAGTMAYDVKKGITAAMKAGMDSANAEADAGDKHIGRACRRVTAMVKLARLHHAALAQAPSGTVQKRGAEVRVEIKKFDAPQRFVLGWATVCSVNGAPVTDLQGDVVDEAEMERYALDFMKDSRAGKLMHDGGVAIDYNVSLPVTSEVKKALGIEFTDRRTGWLLGGIVRDPEVFKRVESGELRAFSIGGVGVRQPLP